MVSRLREIEDGMFLIGMRALAGVDQLQSAYAKLGVDSKIALAKRLDEPD